MKKSILFIAMMLFGIFWATMDVNANQKSEFAGEHIAASISEASLETAPMDCKVTIRKKVPNGWEEYQVTVHGYTCGELAKEILKK
jgi:hypothetical protein